jgi:hypothetical protein
VTACGPAPQGALERWVFHAATAPVVGTVIAVNYRLGMGP